MRVGNTTEREAPWKFQLDFSRFKLRNWRNPGLIYTHIGLKLLIFLIHLFGRHLPAYDFINDNYGGFFIRKNFHMELRMYLAAILVLVDFFVTKNLIGPRITGLHHGIKREEAEPIKYHFYAEKDFLTRYSAADRDTFFTTFVFFTLFWTATLLAEILNFRWRWLPITIFEFTGVYLNFYLFVQTRYYRQWSMSKFMGTWLYNWIIMLRPVEDTPTYGFQNAYTRPRY